MSAYIIRVKGCESDVFVSVGPTSKEDRKKGRYCLEFEWTSEKADAVRFASRWHAKKVARALVKHRIGFGPVTLIKVSI